MLFHDFSDESLYLYARIASFGGVTFAVHHWGVMPGCTLQPRVSIWLGEIGGDTHRTLYESEFCPPDDSPLCRLGIEIAAGRVPSVYLALAGVLAFAPPDEELHGVQQACRLLDTIGHNPQPQGVVLP